MKFFLVYLLIVSTFKANCQLKSVLLDAHSKKAVPYASVYVKGQMKGTNAELDGTFQIEIESNDSLIISSIGYNSLLLSFEELKDTLFMQPEVLQLKQVKVTPKGRFKLFALTNKLGNVSNFYFRNSSWKGTAGHPYEIARLFKYEDNIASTRFVKSITFVTDSDVNDAVFLVKFYRKGNNGLPGELINESKIIASAKKGRNKTKISVEEEFIYFPKEGMFVGVEFLLVDQNKVKRESSYTFESSQHDYKYQPYFSTEPIEEHPFN